LHTYRSVGRAKDVVMDKFGKEKQLPMLQLIPCLFQHVGMWSSLWDAKKRVEPNLKIFMTSSMFDDSEKI